MLFQGGQVVIEGLWNEVLLLFLALVQTASFIRNFVIEGVACQEIASHSSITNCLTHLSTFLSKSSSDFNPDQQIDQTKMSEF